MRGFVPRTATCRSWSENPRPELNSELTLTQVRVKSAVPLGESREIDWKHRRFMCVSRLEKDAEWICGGWFHGSIGAAWKTKEYERGHTSALSWCGSVLRTWTCRPPCAKFTYLGLRGGSMRSSVMPSHRTCKSECTMGPSRPPPLHANVTWLEIEGARIVCITNHASYRFLFVPLDGTLPILFPRHALSFYSTIYSLLSIHLHSLHSSLLSRFSHALSLLALCDRFVAHLHPRDGIRNPSIPIPLRVSTCVCLFSSLCSLVLSVGGTPVTSHATFYFRSILRPMYKRVHRHT